jgi:D-aminoacyl-tRNA deacylase
MILIVASKMDPASLNIREQIVNLHAFTETPSTFQHKPIFTRTINGEITQIITLNQEAINAQDLPKSFAEINLIIFISRHSSLSGKPTLSVHTPGNLGPETLGGKPNQVSISPANAMRNTLRSMAKMKEEMKLNYEVSYEATHHGPSLLVPTMFAELGSSPEQWKDTEAATAVANATIEAVGKLNDKPAKTVLGIGGPHYNSKFTRAALEEDIAFGHIIAKHSIPQTTVETLNQCIERTLEKVELAILDWKGIRGEDKPRILQALGQISLQHQKV